MPLWIGLMGAAGVLARYGIDRALAPILILFPLSTFMINIVGSFLIGAIYVVGAEKGLISKEMSIVVTVGFLGGFTTFSAYSLQVLLLARDGQVMTSLLYSVLCPALSIAGAFLGIILSRMVF